MADLRFYRGRDGTTRAHRPSCRKQPSVTTEVPPPTQGAAVKAATCCKPLLPGQSSTEAAAVASAERQAKRAQREATAHSRVVSLNERLHAARPSEAAMAASEPQAIPTDEPRVDRKVGAASWQVALWAKAHGPLLEGLIDGAFPAAADRPRVQDRNWLRVSSLGQARTLLAAIVAARPKANAYHTWLLDLTACQLRQAYPTAPAPELRVAWNQAAGALNTLRDAKVVADWRAYAAPGPLLTFLVTYPDGRSERLRPRAALTAARLLASARADASAAQG